MLFRKWGCLVGPENSIFRKLKSVDPKKMPLTTEIDLHFYFPFKAFPENERERERARVRERRSDECDLAVARSHRWSQSRRREIVLLIAISRRRDRAVDRDLAFARSRRREIREEDPSRKIARSERKIRQSRSRLREIAPARDPRGRIWTVFEFFLGCGLYFSRFVFSFFFSKHQKIFSEKFFEMQPNTWKHFPFPENMYFPENVLQQPNTA